MLCKRVKDSSLEIELTVLPSRVATSCNLAREGRKGIDRVRDVVEVGSNRPLRNICIFLLQKESRYYELRKTHLKLLKILLL